MPDVGIRARPTDAIVWCHYRVNRGQLLRTLYPNTPAEQDITSILTEGNGWGHALRHAR
jgi:hypothetical protein